MDNLPRRRYPCAECPFRRDTAPGQFPACRYEALQATAGAPGAEVSMNAPIFACHKSTEGRDQVRVDSVGRLVPLAPETRRHDIRH